MFETPGRIGGQSCPAKMLHAPLSFFDSSGSVVLQAKLAAGRDNLQVEFAGQICRSNLQVKK